MAREMYADVITQRDNVDNKLVALGDIRVTVKRQNPDLTLSATNVYTTRTGDTTKGSSGVFITTDGRVEFFVNPGIYQLTFEDTTGQNRISTGREIWISSVSYDDPRLLWATGMTLMWPSTADAPTGFVKLNGAQMNKSTYAALYAIVSDEFNLGTETAGYFRLPNIAGRSVVGPELSASLLTAFTLTQRSIGGRFGSKAVNQPVTVDAHTHVVRAHGHGQGTLVINHGDMGNPLGDDQSASNSQFGTAVGGGFANVWRHSKASLSGTIGAYSSLNNDSDQNTSAASATSGSTSAPDGSNYQPSLVMDMIIAI